MRKTIMILAFFMCSTMSRTQTLFNIGPTDVSAQEFMKAFNKNPDTSANREDKLKEYLDLYIRFKLKLQAAKDAGLDKDQNLILESDNFKSQLAENFINQQADLSQLIQEAYKHSLKDIWLSQVFVRTLSPSDSFAAKEIINKAYEELKSGADFGTVTNKYSTEPNIKANGGSLGYITVFTLPYEIEKLVYSVPVGGYSNVYKSSIGYHIFKNNAERPAIGRRSFQQLLVPTPDFFTDVQRQAAAKTADSLFKVISEGTPFSKFLSSFGTGESVYEPNATYEMAVGQYDENFEKIVFGLNKVNDISKPFLNAYGYNIIRLDKIMPVSTDMNDVMNYAWLQEKIQQDGRLEKAKDALIDKWMTDTHFKSAAFSKSDLWAYTDSAIYSDEGLPAQVNSIQPGTVLFQFSKQEILVQNWIEYIQTMQPGETNADEYSRLFESFKRTTCATYYRSHIEDYNPDITGQMKEFNDANMLFAIMDSKVWSGAVEDSAGLNKYYEDHKSSYKWMPGFSAVLVSATDEQTALEVASKIKDSPASWKTIADNYGIAVVADSGRFEYGQLPISQPFEKKVGFITKPEFNESSQSYTFILISELHDSPSSRSFEDAKGLVINDYQQQLEEQWLETLRKKYPVKVNEDVFKKL